MFRSCARVLSKSVDRQWLGADRRQGRSQRREKQELWTLIGGSTSEFSSKPPKIPTVTNAQFGETISFDRVVTKNCHVDPGRVN